MILRTSFVASALGLILAAQAVTFDLQSRGVYTQAGISKTVTDLPTSDFSDIAVVGLTYSFDTNAITGAITNGTGILSIAGGDTLNFTFTGSSSKTSTTSNDYVSAHGVLASFSGLIGGIFHTGTGVLSFDLRTKPGNVTNGTSLTNFNGDVEPVPEPASLAALGLGALAMLRRRKTAPR